MGQYDLTASSTYTAATTSAVGSKSNRQVSTLVQLNPWGRSSDDSGLNPHRSDLWYVDFSSAVKGLQSIAEDVKSIPSYYVSSISLPAPVMVRADTFRRDSIPYQMPSWDEPLEPLTLTFLMESVNPNPVVDFLTTWQAQTRAGRGERFTNGFGGGKSFTENGQTVIYPNYGQVTLDENYSITFMYTFVLWLLQGSTAPASAPVQYTDTFQQQLKLQQLEREAQDPWKYAASPQVRQTTTQDYAAAAASARKILATKPAWCQCERIFPLEVRGWLASFKYSDLTYKGTDLVTIEARFYPEYIEQQS